MSVELRVTDVKQWAYCPRIVFFEHVVPVDRVRTFPMRRGAEAQGRIESLERRRRMREYGLAEGERCFDVWVRSADLSLSGRIDLLVVTEEFCFPVEFKHTVGGVRGNHRLQLAAYAMLAEGLVGKRCPRGFVYLVPSDEVVSVSITDKLRASVRTAVEAMRRMITDERMPAPTKVRARCTACEFQNYCGDIW